MLLLNEKQTFFLFQAGQQTDTADKRKGHLIGSLPEEEIQGRLKRILGES